MAETDFKYWKVGPKMIKDEDDLLKVKQLIVKHYAALKDVFVSLAARSSWPVISSQEYSSFVQKCKIPDKVVNGACIDRAFIATNVKAREGTDIPGKPGYALCRFEFLEIVVRLATEKYKGTNIVATYHEALEKLITDHILHYF